MPACSEYALHETTLYFFNGDLEAILTRRLLDLINPQQGHAVVLFAESTHEIGRGGPPEEALVSHTIPEVCEVLLLEDVEDIDGHRTVRGQTFSFGHGDLHQVLRVSARGDKEESWRVHGFTGRPTRGHHQRAAARKTMREKRVMMMPGSVCRMRRCPVPKTMASAGSMSAA